MAERVMESSSIQVQADHLSFEDFLKLYDGRHAEWLVGKVLVHMANNDVHQNLFIFLTSLLHLFLGFKPIGRLMVSPFSMYMGETKPAREPDLMIILNEHQDRIKRTFLDGAADIAIEIVSPESTTRDYGEKFAEYEAAGVREYWLIDPERKQADVYVLGENGRFARRALDAEGRLTSTLLPNFALAPEILWREELPKGAELLRLVGQMTGIQLG